MAKIGERVVLLHVRVSRLRCDRVWGSVHVRIYYFCTMHVMATSDVGILFVDGECTAESVFPLEGIF